MRCVWSFWRQVLEGLIVLESENAKCFLESGCENLRGIVWVSTRCMFWLLAVSRTQASYSPDVYPDMFGQ